MLLSLCGCNDWLNVEPKTEIKADKMFENETGYKNALIGAYLMMTDASLYGKEMTIGMFDVMAQQYEMDESNSYKSIRDYNYENNAFRIDGIWNKTYRIIANLNHIIEKLEDGKSFMHPTAYGIIKGESYGLRAYLHFELLRIFGWGNLVNDPANLDKLCIPYVTRYDKSTTKQSTVKEVLAYIHEDLKVSLEMLDAYDPYGESVKADNYELPEDDGFYSKRVNRFNYLAAKALEGRVYMWEGNYEKALESIEKLFIENPRISWVNPDRSIHVEEDKRDLSYTTEHIFNLSVNKMYEVLKPYVEKYTIEEGFSRYENNSYFYITKTNGDLLYEIADGTGVSDYRYLRGLNKVDATAWTFLKFYEAPNSSSPSKNVMPLMRKPEMFYYAAECYLNLGKKEKAIETLNNVRLARGILYSKNLPNSLTDEQVQEEILKEWRKEYIGEGQMFFYYKRLGLSIPNASIGAGDRLFVLPLPEKEVEIGGREDYKDEDDIVGE